MRPGQCRPRRSALRKLTVSNPAISTAHTNPPSRSTTTRCLSPGSAEACASSISAIRIYRGRSATTCPNRAAAKKTVKSNDVFRADNGLLYLIDRLDGLEILESEV